MRRLVILLAVLSALVAGAAPASACTGSILDQCMTDSATS